MWILSASVSVDNNLPTKPSHCCCPPMTAPSTLLDERASCLAHIPPPIILTSGQTYARVLAYAALQRLTGAGGFSPLASPHTLLLCFHKPCFHPSWQWQTGKTSRVHSWSQQAGSANFLAPRRILGPSLGCKPNCAIP